MWLRCYVTGSNWQLVHITWYITCCATPMQLMQCQVLFFLGQHPIVQFLISTFLFMLKTYLHPGLFLNANIRTLFKHCTSWSIYTKSHQENIHDCISPAILFDFIIHSFDELSMRKRYSKMQFFKIAVFVWSHHFPKLRITNPSEVLASQDLTFYNVWARQFSVVIILTTVYPQIIAPLE